MSGTFNIVASATVSHSGAPKPLHRREVWHLLAVVIAVAAPHTVRLGPWLLGLVLLCVGWRAAAAAGRLPMPGSWTKAGLVITSFLAVGLQFGVSFALEPAVVLLVLACFLRLLETTNHSHAVGLTFLCLFMIGTQFLFEQSIVAAGIGALGVLACGSLLVLLTLYGVAADNHMRRHTGTFVRVSRLLLEAAPVAILVFLFFPRINPFWEVPLPLAASTGIPDVVAPGDIAQLSRSSELAFRVAFEGPIPLQSERYWRTSVFYEFRAGQWRPGLGPSALVREQRRAAPPTGPTINSRVIMEPNQRRWLPGLGWTTSSHSDVLTTQDQRIVARRPVLSRFAFDAQSHIASGSIVGLLPQSEEQDASRILAAARELRDRGNPRTRALIAGWQAEGLTPLAIVERMLTMFRNEPFAYTLSPPGLPREGSIDAFLFDTRTGFCAHYASSMTFALRAAGLPARLVAGYQGGAASADGDYVTVRQYDAHAWVEVYLADTGWLRVDPTAAVAPERIEFGLPAAIASEDADVDLSWGLREYEMFGGMLRYLDSLDHHWNMWVIGYDQEAQSQYLQRLLGDVSLQRWALAIVIGVIGLVSLYFAVVSVDQWRVRRAREAGPARTLQRWGARAGLPRAQHEPLLSYGQRLAQAIPERADAIMAVAGATSEWLYIATTSAQEEAQLRSRLRTAARALGRPPNPGRRNR